MGDRSDTQTLQSPDEAAAPVDEDLEGVLEDALESKDLTAINGEAVVEVLLRRSGVLPQETEIGTPDEEAQLPAPRQEDEFVCSRCFLIKPRTQLANAAQRVCRDCLEPPHTEHAS